MLRIHLFCTTWHLFYEVPFRLDTLSVHFIIIFFSPYVQWLTSNKNYSIYIFRNLFLLNSNCLNFVWATRNKGVHNAFMFSSYRDKSFFFFFFFRILNIFDTYTRGEGRKFLKKLIVVYIQKGLTLGYTAQVLNLFNPHSFSYVGLTHCFFFWKY